MKKLLTLIVFGVMFSCGGSLSDEQRKEMKEKMEENKIVRVTEVEITEAAFSTGRETVARLDSLASDSSELMSFLEEEKGRIHFLKPGGPDMHVLEKQLIDAYLADPSGAFQDNVQEVRNEVGGADTLLYTKPVTKKLADGREELVGVWNIWLSKKDLVIGISRKR